ncbi:hypothetical protein C7M84_004975 [Penaeus vannamei]|uniref:E3 ubiquitin-protein ligase n=1 Tax=Penaeus vannamei TaxID=6689 RepID=A0A3R7MAC6_PENVA|nr:hypothetical protein C7M84_004975 [Penaeus vannamei]
MAEATSKDNVAAEEKEESEAEKESPQQTPVPPQKRDDEEELECAVVSRNVYIPCACLVRTYFVSWCGKPKQACAMCRQEIPADFLDHPTLLSSIEAEKEEVLPGGYQWFYEGRNGWWRYDERTNTDIEEAYAQGETSLTLLIAGYNYDIDLTNMKQARADCPGLRRRIKRDVVSSSAKGTAGLSTKLFRGQGGRGRSRGRKRKSDDKD